MSIVHYHESHYVTVVLDMYGQVNGLNSSDTKLSCFTSDWRSTTVSVETHPFKQTLQDGTRWLSDNCDQLNDLSYPPYCSRMAR